MDRRDLVAELAEGLAVALRLRDAGATDEVIATALGIPLQSVPVTVRIAEAKLAALAAATHDAVVPAASVSAASVPPASVPAASRSSGDRPASRGSGGGASDGS